MSERLYADLAQWWPLLSPREDYAPEADAIVTMLRQTATGAVRSVLDLGSGGGTLASLYPEDLDLVLLDRSPEMLDISRVLMPSRLHVQGDMRDARLGRTFDAVVLHDAVMYLTDRADVRAAFRTAFEHLRPGGAFLVLPDCVAESFAEGIDAGGGEEGDRAARLFEWTWDPDPSDETYRLDMAFMLREGDQMRVVHDSHTMALYPRDFYWQALREAGFVPVEADPLLSAERGGETFAARRP